MADFLGTPLGRLLFGGTAAGKLYDRDQQKQQYQGLLDKYSGSAPWAPVSGGGILGGQPANPAFFFEAAKIPSYEHLVGGQQAQQGAMERQQQAQHFGMNNISAFDRAQLEQQAENARLPWSMGMTPYQQAASNQGWAGLMGQIKPKGGTVYDNLTPKEQQEANLGFSRADSALSGAKSVLDWVEKRPTGGAVRGIGTGDAGAMATEWQLSVLPIMKDIVASGALDAGEREWMTGLMGDPTKSLTMTDNERRKMAAVVAKVEQYRGNLYKSYGVQVPDLGLSAVAASQPVQPVGQVRPVGGGGGNVYSGQIQR